MTLSDSGPGRTAKPLFIGSIPIAASKNLNELIVCNASLNSPFPFGSLLCHNLGKTALTWANECTKNVRSPVKPNIPTGPNQTGHFAEV
jgi:hypothetical protein